MFVFSYLCENFAFNILGEFSQYVCLQSNSEDFTFNFQGAGTTATSAKANVTRVQNRKYALLEFL